METDEAIKYPGQHDFLLGRGGETNNHSGNILFRQLIKEFKEAYQNAPKTQKPLISQKLVAKWRGMSPPGRFLERNEQDKVWRDVGDVVACRKTSKALGERGKRNKHGHSDTEDDPPEESAVRNKRKMDDLKVSDIMRSPPSNRVKAAPPTAATTTGMSLPAGPTAVMSTAPVSSAGAPAAANGPSSFLQSLGMTHQATAPTARTVAAAAANISPNGSALAALIEQHQRQQQQQSSIAALLELQTRQQQQLLPPKLDLAALLGQTNAPASTNTSTTTDLATWLSEQQAKQDLTALFGQTNRPTVATSNADLAALLMGQQQQQQNRQVDLSALLPQNANMPTSSSGISDLATLLGQQKQQNDLVALLDQQQKKQQAQSSLASLLDQQQHPQQSELTALLEKHNRSQHAQSTLAALIDQQQQTSGLAALLEQQKKHQLENSLASLLDQKKQHHQQLDLAALLGQQPTQQQPKVTPEQLQSTIAAVLEQQQKTQQLQASLAAVLGHQPTQQHIQLAALLQQQSNPPACGTAPVATGISGERVNSILSATSVPPSASQPRGESLLATASSSTRSLDSKPPAVMSNIYSSDSKPPAVVPNNYLSDLLAALGDGQRGATAPAAAVLPSSTARLQSLLDRSQATLTSPSSTGGAAPQGVKLAGESLIVQRKRREQGTKTTGLAVVGNSAQVHPPPQQPIGEADLLQMLAAAKDRQRHQPVAATAPDEHGNERATATLAAALRQMESNLVQQYQRMANNGNGQNKP